MVMSYPYVILDVSFQRHKTRGHCQQPLELAFLSLDQCGGALLQWDEARLPGEEEERPDDSEHESHSSGSERAWAWMERRTMRKETS